MNSKPPIHIIGLGIGREALSPAQQKLITQGEVLAGGKDSLARWTGHPGEKIPIHAPVSRVIELLNAKHRQGKKIIILCSGDPLFFGLGTTLLQHFPRTELIFHPNITTVQAAAARAKLPWSNFKTLSLHGRHDLRPLYSALKREKYLAIYTDNYFTPQHIARTITSLGAAECFTMTVFADLGLPSERITAGSPQEIAQEKFSPLNFVLLCKNQEAHINTKLGIAEHDLAHQQGLITKKEIRAISLAALEIAPDHVIWDLGAGSGAVSIEAAHLADHGLVIAVEKDPLRIRQIEANRNHTHAFNIQLVQGTIPECLNGLPRPDRIFVGGGISSSKDTQSKIRHSCLEQLVLQVKSPGIIVANLVLMRSLEQCLDFCRTHGLTYELTQIQFNRLHPLADDNYLKAFNPVFVLKIKTT